MNRINLLPRLAALALATVLAVAAGATALSQVGEAPTFVDVTVKGAMSGDAIAVPGVGPFGTADADGNVTQNVPKGTADDLKAMDSPFTVNGETAMGSWDGYTYTIMTEPEEPVEPEEPEPTVMTVPADKRLPVTPHLEISFPWDADDAIPPGTSTKLQLRLSASSGYDVMAKDGDISGLSYGFGYINDALGNVTIDNGLLAQVGLDTAAHASLSLRETAMANGVISHEDLKVIVPNRIPEETIAELTASVQVGVTVNYTDADGQEWTYTQRAVAATDVTTLRVATVEPDADSITFGFNAKMADDPKSPDHILRQTGRTGFTLNIHNIEGAPSQISSISSIVVSTNNGVISYTGTAHSDIMRGIDTDCSGHSPTCEFEPLKGSFWPLDDGELTFGLTGSKMGTADVSVAVITRAGKAMSASQTVIVFGPAATLTVELNPDEGNLHYRRTHPADDDKRGRDLIEFTVKAYDANGVRVGVPALSDGEKQLTVMPDNSKPLVKRVRTPMARSVEVMPAPKVKLTPGDATVTVKGGAASGTGDFVVAGPARKIVLGIEVYAADDHDREHPKDHPDTLRDLVLVTATVTDENENAVAKGTKLEVKASDLDGDIDSILVKAINEHQYTDADGISTEQAFVTVAGRALVGRDAAVEGRDAIVTAWVVDAHADANGIVGSAKVHSTALSTEEEAKIARAEAEAEAEAKRIAAEEAAEAERQRIADEEAEAERQRIADEEAEAERQRIADEEAAEAERVAELVAAVQAALEAEAAAAAAAAAEAEAEAAAAAAAAAEAAAEAAAAAAAAAEAEVAAETERLSGMTGFVGWLSATGTSASALFEALADDGATALHLWTGSTWVRYSVVGGAAVPGSVDFDVSQGDVLFISN